MKLRSMNSNSTKRQFGCEAGVAHAARFAWLFLLAFLVNSAQAGPPARERATAAALAAWAEAEFAPALADHRYSGLVMTVVKDGEVVFNRGYGKADPFKGTAVDPSATLFRIGSTTKVFTATAIAQLLEEGRIASLDDPANKYLKRVQLPDAGGKAITVWHLLTHRAGFEDSAYGLGAKVPPKGALATTAEIERFMPQIVRPAGSVSVYSNYSTALLGLMVEDVSGLPIKRFFDERIFRPLGMTHTRLSDDFHSDPALGVPAATFPDGSLQAVPYIGMRPLIAPAGGIVTTGDDMARFMAAHLGTSKGGKAILSADTMRLMHTPKVRNHPAVSGFGMKFMVQEWNGATVLEHGGGWPGFQTVMVLLPESGVGVFISIMGSDAAAGIGEQIASLVVDTRLKAREGLSVKRLLNALVVREDLLSYLLGPWQPVATAPPTVGSVNLDAYAGSYRRERRSYSSFEALFDLFSTRSAVLQIEKGPADELRINGVPGFRAVAPDVFWNAKARPRLDGDPNAQALYAFTMKAGSAVAVTPLLSVDQWSRTHPVLNPATLAPVLLVVFLFGLTSVALPFWPAADGVSRIGRWLPVAQWVLLLAVPLVLLTGYGDGDGLAFRLLPGEPARFVALLAITNLAALVAIATFAVAAMAWRSSIWGGGWRGRFRRVHFSALALSALALLYCFGYFNLLGVKWP
jgi:CubicO group peptidase (beta-lactamase class C family)